MTTIHTAARQMHRLAESWDALCDALVRRGQADPSGIRAPSPETVVPFDERASDLRRDLQHWAYFIARVLAEELEVTRIVQRTIWADGAYRNQEVQVVEPWTPPDDQSVPSLLRTIAREDQAMRHLLGCGLLGDELDDLSLRLDVVLGPRPSRTTVMARHLQLLEALGGRQDGAA